MMLLNDAAVYRLSIQSLGMHSRRVGHGVLVQHTEAHKAGTL